MGAFKELNHMYLNKFQAWFAHLKIETFKLMVREADLTVTMDICSHKATQFK